MATKFDTTGVIVKTSDDTAIASVSFDGKSNLLPFTKRIFYSFGLPCNGRLSNILEVGAEVEICCKTSASGGTCIVSVWVGEKPEVFNEDALTPLYEQKGIVTDSFRDDIIVDSGHKVLVSKEVVYRDGLKIDESAGVSVARGEEISFDAVPLEDEHISGAVYWATCAWIGAPPKMVDRFRLKGVEDCEVDFDQKEWISSTVVAIANDAVALVDVNVESTPIKVMLFRSSFNQSCNRIQDLVDVGDSLLMRVNYAYVFRGRKQWFVEHALKASDEVSLDTLENNSCDTQTDREKAVIEIAPDCAREVEGNVAVQFGRSSKVLYSNPPLKGTLSMLDCGGWVISYGDCKVLVDPGDFYVDGDLETDCFESYVASGKEEVNFEAIARGQRDLGKNKIISHIATCVWVGIKPTVTLRASVMSPANFRLLDDKDKVFYGIVTKICLPKVALVLVPRHSTTVSVHEKNFAVQLDSTRGERLITDYVTLKDYVTFKVTTTPVLPKLLSACDVRVMEQSNGPLIFPPFPSKEDVPVPSTSGVVPSRKTFPTKTVEVKAGSNAEPDVCIASAFKKGCLLQKRSYMNNCCGVIKSKPGVPVPVIEHVFGSSRYWDGIVYMRAGKIVESGTAAGLNNVQVRFDAVLSQNSKDMFVIKRMWDSSDNRPPCELVLYSELKLPSSHLITTRCCPGVIIAVPFHDAAIARVKNVPVLVPVGSLVVLQEINGDCWSIDRTLAVGDFVGLKFEEVNFTGGKIGTYFRAVSCWALSKGGRSISENDQVRVGAPRINSWFDKWGYGAIFCEGPVNYIGGKYVVDFKPAKLPNSIMTLDLFEKGNVYVNEKLIGADEFEAHLNKKVNFHVAHEHLENLSDDMLNKTVGTNGMFVACAWIGKYAPEVMFADTLSVPKGIICSNWVYEMIVESFPVPTHALCSLGVAPVLVPIPGITKESKAFRFSTDEVNLKKGDRVRLVVLEETVGDTTVLVSNLSAGMRLVKEIEFKDVLINVSGIIDRLPKPTGLIKPFIGAFEVSFELCNFRRAKNSTGSDKQWLKGLINKIELGQKVIFSAVKVSAKSAPYKAFEVYFP